MAPKFRFAEGEKVFCFHGPLLYEAKCIKVVVKDKAIKYRVHYQGWNKNWDEWVPENRVLKFNEPNLQKQKELQEAHNLSKSKGKTEKRKKLLPSGGPSGGGPPSQSGDAPSTPSPASTTGKTKSTAISLAAASMGTGPGSTGGSSSSGGGERDAKKRKLDLFVESEETYALKLEVKIKIPEELKPWLVDDWDLITRQKKIFQLPARVSVDQILEEYVRGKRQAGSRTKESALVEVTAGIKEYFNVMLGSQLLYRFERPQYKSIIDEFGDDTNMSSIYGAVYLLRLFVRLGSNLVFTTLDEKSIQLLLSHIHDFLKFMARNPSYFSHNDYVVASPEYHRKAVQ